MNRTGIIVWLAVLLCRVAMAQPGPANPGFEEGKPGDAPAGWFVPTPGFSATQSNDSPFRGSLCLKLARSQGEEGGSLGNVMQSIPARPYRGQRVRLTASLRARDGAAAQMWLRVDRPGGAVGGFDNMAERPVRSARWTPAAIQVDIAPDAESISLGLMLIGDTGSVWIDDVELVPLGPIGAGDEAPSPLTESGLANLLAFARVYGVVRYFHPSDEARQADWNLIAIEGVRRVESAGNAEELVQRLREVFGHVAPGAGFWSGDDTGQSDSGVLNRAAHAVAMRYMGMGSEGQVSSVYSARRERWDSDGNPPSGMPAPGEAWTERVSPGVWASVPIVVYADETGTLPRPRAAALEARARPEGWSPGSSDRATRLGSVIVAWNAFQHFYPYFDAKKELWADELPRALRSAAEDRDADSFHRTLSILAAGLHDGHARVVPLPVSRGRLPLSWIWAEGKLVVTAVPPGSPIPRPGDAVVSIDQKPIADLVAEYSPQISAATEQWQRWRLAEELQNEAKERTTLEFQRPDGGTYGCLLEPAGPGTSIPDHAHASGEELAKGIVYFDLDAADEADLQRCWSLLVGAKGIVFDMRGYPGRAFYQLLPHLSDRVLTSAQWGIPVITRPDLAGVTFQESHWTLPPEEPRLTSNVVFITDGRAISYAESCMGIVEHYKLGRIVGGPTAGTNGNVNTIALPSGQSVLFTGMRVTKQDGSRHHGVGVRPTDPLEPTIAGLAAGRDGLLDRATEIALKAAVPEAP